MKNQTWLYLDNNHTSLYLYMDEYFYSLRTYEKVHNENKVRIEVSFSNYGNGALRVRCWYGRSTEEGKEIYDITYPYRKNLKCVWIFITFIRWKRNKTNERERVTAIYRKIDG